MRTLAVVAVLLLASCERERSTLTPRLALEDVTILAGPGLVRVENGTVSHRGWQNRLRRNWRRVQRH
jgi:hypothetical protein